MRKEPLITPINTNVLEKNFFSSIRNIRAIRDQTSLPLFLTADFADSADNEMFGNHPKYPRNLRSIIFPKKP